MLRRITVLVNRLGYGFNLACARVYWVCGVLLIGVLVLTVVDVILRRVFALPIKGSYEIASVLTGLAMALGIAYAQTERAHLVIEALPFPMWVRHILDNIGRFISLVMYSLLTWQITVLGADFRKVGQVFEAIRFPRYPVVWGLALGCALMSLLLLFELYSSISKKR